MTHHIVIVGAGLSGLASAFYLQQRWGGLAQITLIEKNAVAGGTIASLDNDGYLCEAGPNGFLDNKPQTLALCQQLGLNLLRSNDNARKRFVALDKQLCQVPHSPSEFLCSDILSWRGKIRVMQELFIKANLNRNESVADFTRRRLGPEMLDKLISPMMSGIFAGDPEQLELGACFPRMEMLERKYGGLFKALWQLKHKRGMASVSSGSSGILTSCASGIAELITRLVSTIPSQNILYNCALTAINSTSTREWKIHYTQAGQLLSINADILIIATPAYAATHLTAALAPQLSNLLSQIDYAPLAVACLGYDRTQVHHALDGFGYLYASNQGAPILGTLWDSAIFPNRAPVGKVLLRSMLGGALNRNINALSNEQVINIAHVSCSKLLGITAAPEMTQVFRYEKAIPQYNIGHRELVRCIKRHLELYPNLFITGNAYEGIGINDCIMAAQALADKITLS